MKRRSTDPTNTATVPVLDAGGGPLMPTRPSRARRLLRAGRAEKIWRKGLFCIRMLDRTKGDSVVDGVELNINPGTTATGIAVVSESKSVRQAHALIELRHRGSRVRKKMDRRRSMRRFRRSRLRNRPPRFNNRTRPSGWLAPSLETRLANTLTWVTRISALYPVRLVRVETARFDTQLMQNPEISGKQYQQGDLLGWQLRSYVFHRDGRICAYCGDRRAKRYELDHIAPRSTGGTDRVSNLVVSCHDCNIAKGNMSVEKFLAEDPGKLRAIGRIRRAPLAGAAQMNVIIPTLINRLEDLGFAVSRQDSYTTSWTRGRLGVPKTRVNDALCLGKPMSINLLPERMLIAQAVGHGDRQMLRPTDKHGNPRGRGYREYCALDRQRQGYTRCPGHRLSKSRVAGIGSGDLVQFTHRKHGTLRGHASLMKNTGRVVVKHGDQQISVKAASSTLLAQNHGYRLLVAENSA